MDNTKKKNIKRVVLWCLLAALVVLLAVMPMLAQQEQEADGPVASVLEATVQTGSVSTTLRGGGTLEAGKTMDITLPSGVKITEFLVKNGDSITEGTPVAAVDRVSVMNAILEVEDTLDYLRDEIADAEDEKVSSSIRATAGGRVKQVFAQPGERVQDVMLEHGALAVLSLDGRMAVELERNANLAAGDTVVVAFSSGEEVDGRVESNLDGIIVVTVEDDKYEVDTPVTVTTQDGDRLGTGKLYVHNAWKATAYSGTVSTVSAKVDSEVAEDAILLTLKDTDYEGTKQSLSNLHREYEELLQELFQMYETEVITAPCNGMVSGVDEDSEFLLSAIEGEQGWFVDLLGNEIGGEEKGWTVRLLSNTETNCSCDLTVGAHVEGCIYVGCTETSNCQNLAGKHSPNCDKYCDKTKYCSAPQDSHLPECPCYCSNSNVCDSIMGKHFNECPYNCSIKADCKAKFHYEGCPEICTNSDQCKVSISNFKNHLETCPKRCQNITGCTSGINNHLTTCPEICLNSEFCQASRDSHVLTCPMLCNRGDTCKAPDGQHFDDCVAIVTESYTGFVGYVINCATKDNGEQKLTLAINGNGNNVVSFTYGNKKLKYDADVEDLAGGAVFTPGEYIGVNGSFSQNDIVLVTQRQGQLVAFNTGKKVANKSDNSNLGSFDISGLISGLPSGFAGMTGAMAGMGTTQQVELFPLDGDTLMTITDLEVVTVELAIDEHDIAKVSIGQPASVEITALKGETFEAEVTDIANYGTNNGGSAKFAVEVTLGYDPRLLVGFNATAAIPLSTKMDVLTIPVAALVETETGTCVCTGLDKETGLPANLVPVEIGVSDGEIAEVISGLSSGDTVYYEYYDKVEMDNTAKAEITFG